LTTFDDSYA